MDPVQPIRERLRDLAANPFGRRIPCDVDPDQIPAVQSDDDGDIEQIETDGWNNEEVHGGDIWGMIAQEGPPSLAWVRISLMVSGDFTRW